MEKVFLVEDEVIVREGIKKNIDWEKNGFLFVGDASDGELALTKIRETKPDILITDIRMPFMDGIELSRIVKKELPDTEIILLTGFQEFTYAKEAISIGVSEYLTKPISGEELLHELSKISEKIRMKKEEALKQEEQEMHLHKQKDKLDEIYQKLISMDKEEDSRKDEFDLDHIDTNLVGKNLFPELLRTGSLEDVAIFTAKITDKKEGNFFNSLMFRQYVLMNAFLSTVSFVEGLGISRDKIEALDPASDVLTSVEEAKKYIIRVLSQGIRFRDEKAGSKYQGLVSEVIRYIANHYMDPELSLQEIAEEVSMSPNHLSVVFSQETGGTLIKYLTDYRLKKAKELLRCTSMRSSEVGEAVGYLDPHYFSSLFKKNLGVTPTQFRDSHE